MGISPSPDPIASEQISFFKKEGDFRMAEEKEKIVPHPRIKGMGMSITDAQDLTSSLFTDRFNPPPLLNNLLDVSPLIGVVLDIIR